MRKTLQTTRRRRRRRRMRAPQEDREPTRRGVTTTVGQPPRILRDRSNHHSPTRGKQRQRRLQRRFRSTTYVARNFDPHNGVDSERGRGLPSRERQKVKDVSVFIGMRMIRMSSSMRTDPYWVTAWDNVLTHIQASAKDPPWTNEENCSA